MTAVGKAQRVKNNKVLVDTARAGFVGYGILHLVLAWLAAQIAFGHATEEGDQSGAFQALSQQSIGKVLLALIAIGLFAMALWQGLTAAIGHDKVTERIVSGCRTVVYVVLGISAVKALAGTPSSGSQKSQNASGGVLGHTAGVWLIALVGLVVIGVGVGLVVIGVLRKYDDNLMTGRMNRTTRTLSHVLGTSGYVAKGTAFAIAGVLLVDAAVTHDPKKGGGLDSALHTLAGEPYGKFLLLLMALGIAAFGVYCFFQARYRKV